MRRRALSPPSPLPVRGSGGGDYGLGATLSRGGLDPRGTLGGRGDLRAGTAARTPFRVEVGGTAAGWARGSLQSAAHVRRASPVPELGASRDARWPDRPSCEGVTGSQAPR